jgi:N-acetyl-gamma-glutamyl-phosphate reductase
MLRVGIVGATGYTGCELVRLLSGHPKVTLTVITSRQHAGTAYTDIYPAMSGRVDLVCQPQDLGRVAAETDLVFLALPHEVSMTVAGPLLAAGCKVVDLSADFRFRDAALYEDAYQPHHAPELLDRAVYGLTEVYRDGIREAQLIGNPGCYPTSVLLPLAPLVAAGLVDPAGVIADCKSGVSGAGRSPSLAVHYCEVNESFKPYKVTTHRHNPEMEAILADIAGKPASLTFVPHLVPLTRGMQSTIYAGCTGDASADRIRACLREAYQAAPFVRIRDPGDIPDVLHVRGTNFCDIGFHWDAKRSGVILMSVIDNLLKGAAGQAVQNMNIMSGFDETDGLGFIPSAL